MKKLPNVLFNVILSLFLLMPQLIAQDTKPTSDQTDEKIRQVENNLSGWAVIKDGTKWSLLDRMAFYRIKGVSIAVIHNYRIEWSKGYGWADLAEQRKVTVKTLFQAASISKSLNGVGVLKLAQENKIDLDSDINKYLRSWKFPYDEKSGGKKITVANLLSHTAGLTIHGFPGYTRGEPLPSLPQVLDGEKPANTLAVRSFIEPGTKVVYSGGGVTISQQIVLDVTKQRYEDFMIKKVLKPLGMTSSFFNQPPDAGKNMLLATGYKANGDEVKGKYHVYPEQAAAGLWTNPIDLCKYIIDTQLSLRGEPSAVLKPEMTRLRLTPVLESAGLGVFIESHGDAKYFMHNGGNEGFSCTSVGSFDNGNGVVIMTNSDNGAILEEIVNSVASVYNWKDYYQPVVKEVISLPEDQVGKFTGRYQMGGDQITIKKSGKDLIINAVPGLDWKVWFTSDVDFFVMEYRANLKFQTGEDGKVTGITANGALLKKIE